MLSLLKDSKDLVVSLKKVQKELHVKDRDNYLDSLIRMATHIIEIKSNRSFGFKIWKLKVITKGFERILLPNPPVIRLLKVMDSQNKLIDYCVEQWGINSYILVHHFGIVKIVYFAGYGKGIPVNLRNDLLNFIKILYLNRPQRTYLHGGIHA